MSAVKLLILILGFSYCNTVFGQDYAFYKGSRGFLIRELNRALDLQLHLPDSQVRNTFDDSTADKIRQVLKLHHQAIPDRICADSGLYQLLGLKWPNDTARALQLTGQWENTEASLEGPKDSGDTKPNVTYGIVGFTSHDGSLQWFLYHANKRLNGALVEMVKNDLPKDVGTFEDLIKFGHNESPYVDENIASESNREFTKWALESPNGRAKPEVAHVFNRFSQIKGYFDVHLDLCIEKEWDLEAKPTYLKMLFGNIPRPSSRAIAFCIDITTQTNGPKQQTAWLAQQTYTSEQERCGQIMTAMKNAGYGKITKDILEREACLTKGRGMVHGEFYDLVNYGLLPAK